MNIIPKKTNLNIAYSALSMVMCQEPKLIRTIYKKFNDDGLNFLARCTIHFRETGWRILCKEDIEKICSYGSMEHNVKIFKWLCINYLKKFHDVYYFPSYNEIMGYATKPENADVSRFKIMGSKAYDYSVMEPEHTSKMLREIVKESATPLPDYLKRRFKNLNNTKKAEGEHHAAIISLYLRHCINFIGYTTDLSILSNALEISDRQLMAGLKRYNVRVVDFKNLIFYDPEQRRHYGMSGNPSGGEINDLKEKYPERIKFSVNVNFFK